MGEDFHFGAVNALQASALSILKNPKSCGRGDAGAWGICAIYGDQTSSQLNWDGADLNKGRS